MERRQADLGAITQQQEHEGDVEQPRIELRCLGHQHGPDHGVETFSHYWPRRHVDEDGAEQSERDADAAEDEVFPRRFQRFVRAINPDQEHGGQRCQLDRHPHDADVVGEQRQVHGQHQYLVHGVIKTQIGRGQPADLQLVADITGAENAGGEADESAQHDKDVVQIVDMQIRAGRRAPEKQRQRGKETDESRGHIEPRAQPIAWQDGEQRRRRERNDEHNDDRVE
jgi:hypothetical protein